MADDLDVPAGTSGCGGSKVSHADDGSEHPHADDGSEVSYARDGGEHPHADDGSEHPHADDASKPPLIGVLAIQGGYEAHTKMLQRLGARTREVRTIAHLQDVEGLVLPGGESTAIMFGIRREQLAETLKSRVAQGMPLLGSCAGLILLDRDHLDLMDMRVRRNAFGRQARSFEADVQLAGVDGGPVHAIFIRAPWIAEHGPGVEILAEIDGHPVAARQGNLVAVAFHTELTNDTRVHQLLLELVTRSRQQ